MGLYQNNYVHRQFPLILLKRVISNNLIYVFIANTQRTLRFLRLQSDRTSSNRPILLTWSRVSQILVHTHIHLFNIFLWLRSEEIMSNHTNPLAWWTIVVLTFSCRYKTFLVSSCWSIILCTIPLSALFLLTQLVLISVFDVCNTL